MKSKEIDLTNKNEKICEKYNDLVEKWHRLVEKTKDCPSKAEHDAVVTVNEKLNERIKKLIEKLNQCPDIEEYNLALRKNKELASRIEELTLKCSTKSDSLSSMEENIKSLNTELLKNRNKVQELKEELDRRVIFFYLISFNDK